MDTAVPTSGLHDPACTTSSTPRRQMCSARLVAAAGLGLAAATGFAVGVVASNNHPHQIAHTRGACLALEFAENFGAVAPVQKRQALRAMTTSTTLHDGLFPKSVTAFEAACVKTWTSAVRLGR